MSQAPVMPVYPDALIGDTLHLSAEEFGAYLLLLFATWRNNGKPLPDDASKLARICRCPVARWNRVLRPALIGFFKRDDDGLLHQKRLEKEWAFCEQFRTKQAANAALGGRPRKSDKPLENQETDKPNGFSGFFDAAHTYESKTRKKRAVTKLKPEICNTIGILNNPLETLETDKPNGSVWHIPNETPLILEGKKERFSPKKLNLSPLPSARDASPLPSRGDGAALRAPTQKAEPDPPTAFDDPELRAEAIATFSRCLDAVRGKLPVMDAEATTPPPNPRLGQFRARLQRLNTVASERLDGNTRLQAWETIAAADALGDPLALSPDMLAGLDAIESLEPCAEAAE